MSEPPYRYHRSLQVWRRGMGRTSSYPSTVIWLLAIFCATPWVSQARAIECFRYGSIVTLTGHYQQAILPANSLEVSGRAANVLVLATPLCVESVPISDGVPAATNVQVLCPDMAVDNGASVSITGRLVGAHTSNGHTPVLLVCLP